MCVVCRKKGIVVGSAAARLVVIATFMRIFSIILRIGRPQRQIVPEINKNSIYLLCQRNGIENERKFLISLNGKAGNFFI